MGYKRRYELLEHIFPRKVVGRRSHLISSPTATGVFYDAGYKVMIVNIWDNKTPQEQERYILILLYLTSTSLPFFKNKT